MGSVGGPPSDEGARNREDRFLVPDVRYAQRGTLSIAYQRWSEGNTAVLLIPEWAVAGEAAWEHPGHVRAWRFYASLGRVFRFDRTGIGASDPASPDSLASISDWAADALAVLDAESVESAVVLGEGFGGHAAMMLASAHPERVERLILTNSFARLTRAPNYPFGPPAEFADDAAEFVRSAWGTGTVTAGTAEFLFVGGDYRAFCGRFERIAMSRASAGVLTHAMYTSDVRPLLPSLHMPTLVTHTGDLQHVELAHTQYLTEHLPNATLEVWRSGSFYGSEDRRQGHQEFLHPEGERPRSRVYRAVLFTDIVNSTVEVRRLGDLRWRELLEATDDLTAREVARAGGRIVTRTGDGALADFGSAPDAVGAALNIVKGARVLGVVIRSGVHCGEVELRRDGDLAGLTVHVAARVAAAASGGEVLVSPDAAAALDRTSILLEDRGEHQLKGLDNALRLHAASN